MRLAILDHGHPLRMKLLFVVIRVMSGFRAPDVVKTLRFRPEYFGGHMNRLFQEVMRGPSGWSVGDRELMAAFVSKINACDF